MVKIQKTPELQKDFDELRIAVAEQANERFSTHVTKALESKKYFEKIFSESIRENPLDTYRDLMQLSTSGKKYFREQAGLILTMDHVLSTLQEAGIGSYELEKLLSLQSSATFTKLSEDPESNKVLKELGYDDPAARIKILKSIEGLRTTDNLPSPEDNL